MQVEAIETETATEARADVVLSGRELRDAVKLLSGKAADKRSTIPILASIYFEIAPDGRATLTATDLTAWASLTLQALSDDIGPAPGAFAIEGAALHKVLSKAGKAERIRLTVNTDATRVRLKTGRMEMHLRAIADEFPLAPISAFAAERAGELSRAQFMADLAALAPAMSNEYGRDHLHGIAMQVRDMAERPRLVMAATDGFKLAAAARPIPAGCEGWADCIMPSRTVDLALAAHKLAGAGDALILSQGPKALEIAFGNVSIYSQCVDATFPDWPRAFDSIMAPTDGEQGALFPDLLPEYPAARIADMDKPAPGVIDWQPGKGALIGQCASDPGMVWAVMYLDSHAGRHTAPDYSEGVRVEVEGDREYQIATAGKKIALTKEQVAALCGDDLWNVLEFPGADGRPRYVSQWLWDDGASRFLCVGADGRCPPAGAPREYVTRAEVEAALAGEPAAPISADCELPEGKGPSRPGALRYRQMTDARLPQGHAWHETYDLATGKVEWSMMTQAEARARCERMNAESWEAHQTPEDCAEAAPMAPDAPKAPASAPEPLSCQPAADAPPIMAERGKRSDAERRAIIRAWQMRAAMRRIRAEAEPEAVPAEVMADIAEAERLIRCEGYVAPTPTAIQRPKRTPAHERAIRRAWAERKARRNAKSAAITAETCARSAEAREARLREQLDNADQMRRDWLHSAEAAHKRERIANIKRRRAVLKARDLQTRLYAEHRLVDRANDRRRLAEQEAAEALAAREDLQRLLCDAEARLAAAEAENAQLWAEIEALTAPVPALAA